MTILADESVAGPIIERLRNEGHDVVSIRETMSGAPDTQVLAEAQATRRILLTEDKDFGEMVYRQGAAHHGVVLVRLGDMLRGVRASLVAEAFRKHAAELAGAFTVISRAGVRIRPASGPDQASP